MPKIGEIITEQQQNQNYCITYLHCLKQQQS
jgi:hypothetical protein